MRMNTNNGFWSYFWSGATGFFAMLTLQDILFALGFFVTAVFTWLTYRSNERKNRAEIEEGRRRTEILRDSYVIGGLKKAKEAASAIKELDPES